LSVAADRVPPRGRPTSASWSCSLGEPLNPPPGASEQGVWERPVARSGDSAPIFYAGQAS